MAAARFGHGARRSWRRSLSAISRHVRLAIRGWWREWRRPKTLGELGERAASRMLRRAGMKIVATRHRQRYGEIDIVAVDQRTVVFVEVKTRRSAAPGRPSEAIDARRRGRLTRAAAAFVKSRRLGDCACRFDVVEVIWPHDQRPTLCHLRGAFQAEGPFQFGR